MLPAIAYTIACFIIAALLTCGYVLTRPVHVRDEMRSWRVMLALFALCFAGPYLYNEVLTRIHGPELEKALKTAYADLPINGGHMIYYKVTSFGGNEAKVLLVSEEKMEWGGTDHPQISLVLQKQGKSWKTISYKVLNSERLNKETYVFPVYW
ncbi:MAG: hypothetical protein QOJ65_824 [Fimbriimonadaceae bacterium]|jgi:hypothetical protein|nr:hypothetical protein [Fimbriimonadaceae bacterium]